MTDSEKTDLIKVILPVVEKKIDEVKPYVREYYLAILEGFAKDIRKDTIRTVSEYPDGDISLLDRLMDDAGQLYLFIFEKEVEEYIVDHNISANEEDIDWINNKGWDDTYLKIYDDVVDGERLFELDFDMSIEDVIKYKKDLPENTLFEEFSKGYFHPVRAEK